jgi:hypothetical protein
MYWDGGLAGTNLPISEVGRTLQNDNKTPSAIMVIMNQPLRTRWADTTVSKLKNLIGKKYLPQNLRPLFESFDRQMAQNLETLRKIASEQGIPITII